MILKNFSAKRDCSFGRQTNDTFGRQLIRYQQKKKKNRQFNTSLKRLIFMLRRIGAFQQAAAPKNA